MGHWQGGAELDPVKSHIGSIKSFLPLRAEESPDALHLAVVENVATNASVLLGDRAIDRLMVDRRLVCGDNPYQDPKDESRYSHWIVFVSLAFPTRSTFAWTLPLF